MALSPFYGLGNRDSIGLCAANSRARILHHESSWFSVLATKTAPLNSIQEPSSVHLIIRKTAVLVPVGLSLLMAVNIEMLHQILLVRMK